jgi:hypothetical protein
MIDASALKQILLYAPRKGVFYWIKPPKAHADLLGEEAGSAAQSGSGKSYVNIQIGGRKYRRSRLAFLYMIGRWPDETIDHINGNSLDDRWVNLREATIMQNAWNHHKRRKRSTLPMGVRTNPSGRFSARICVNRRHIQLGTFDCEYEAHEAYRIASIKYYGEFA